MNEKYNVGVKPDNTKEAKKLNRDYQVKRLIAKGHTKKFARQQVKRIKYLSSNPPLNHSYRY